MAPKAKVPVLLMPAPASTSDLCAVCPPQPLDPSTTHVSCPHGSWMFSPAEAATEPDDAT